MSERVQELLAKMTMAEKIGQMTQVAKGSITPAEVTEFDIGSVLSGGGGAPAENTPAGWLAMVTGFQRAALETRLAIPLIYGVDAVHGNANVRGATVFPHNIGLGASRDAELVFRIAEATALETAATGIRWNFAPTVAMPQDLRWGRVYEGYGERAELVTKLGTAYLKGLQGEALSPSSYVVANPKHFVGDGGAMWQTSTSTFPAMPEHGIFDPSPFLIDRGDMRIDEQTLRRTHLMPYVAAVAAGAQVIMASFSSWNGLKMHAHRYLLTDVLKDELGFEGFVVSDWAGLDEISPDYYDAVVTGINAGVDMNMVPMKFRRFLDVMKRAVAAGDITEERIDDAVRRILAVKFKLGLFEQPVAGPELLPQVGCPAHRELAREAAGKSVVLLKNLDETLPLSKSTPLIYVAGRWADDIGLQCGGWTIAWLGQAGNVLPGTSILAGMRSSAGPDSRIVHNVAGHFPAGAEADVGLVFVGEEPYAEGLGDRADLTLDRESVALIAHMRGLCRKLVVVVVSGRPLILTEQLPLMDALVAVWLPGSEGQGVADVLFGDKPFTGKLPYSWPRSMAQIPLANIEPGQVGKEALFPFGFGLT